MIDKKHAGNEIGRLIGQDYFPSDPAAIRELVTALSFSATEIIATVVINEWLEEKTNRPTPADLRRLVASHNERFREDQKRYQDTRPIVYGCRRCQDCGLYGGQVGTGEFDGPWKWCECRSGIDRKQKELEQVESSMRQFDSVAEAFLARVKLIRRLGNKPIMAMSQAHEDVYYGEL